MDLRGSQHNIREGNLLPPLQLKPFHIWHLADCNERSPHHISSFCWRVSALLLVLTWTTRRQVRGPWYLGGWFVRTRYKVQAVPSTGCGASSCCAHKCWEEHWPWRHRTWIQVLALSLSCGVILGHCVTLLDLSLFLCNFELTMLDHR